MLLTIFIISNNTTFSNIDYYARSFEINGLRVYNSKEPNLKGGEITMLLRKKLTQRDLEVITDILRTMTTEELEEYRDYILRLKRQRAEQRTKRNRQRES